jgi:hypothetical protein
MILQYKTFTRHTTALFCTPLKQNGEFISLLFSFVYTEVHQARAVALQ